MKMHTKHYLNSTQLWKWFMSIFWAWIRHSRPMWHKLLPYFTWLCRVSLKPQRWVGLPPVREISFRWLTSTVRLRCHITYFVLPCDWLVSSVPVHHACLGCPRSAERTENKARMTFIGWLFILKKTTVKTNSFTKPYRTIWFVLFSPCPLLFFEFS